MEKKNKKVWHVCKVVEPTGMGATLVTEEVYETKSEAKKVIARMRREEISSPLFPLN